MFYMCHTHVTPAASPIGCCHVASKGDIKRLMCAMACDIGGDMAATYAHTWTHVAQVARGVTFTYTCK